MVKSLLLSLLLHLLIVFLLFVSFKDVTFPEQIQEQSMSLRLNEFVAPKPVFTLPVAKKAPTSEEHISNDVAKKKIFDEKKRLLVKEKSKEENNVTKIVPIIKKKLVKKTVKKRKIRVKKKERVSKKRKRSKDKLANALMGFGTPRKLPSTKAHNPIDNIIKRLYGKEFKSFTSTQKKFIRENLGAIQRITQNTLSRNGYPDVAIHTKQEGTAIVTFYLHSNGAISSLRLKKRIGYAALDENTMSVIKLAYKDYPYPKSVTKITFYVKYSLH
jgi:TonB family protein